MGKKVADSLVWLTRLSYTLPIYQNKPLLDKYFSTYKVVSHFKV